MSQDIALPDGWMWVKLQDLALNPKADIVDGPFGSDLKASEDEKNSIYHTEKSRTA